jgi:hypothetical protein
MMSAVLSPLNPVPAQLLVRPSQSMQSLRREMDHASCRSLAAFVLFLAVLAPAPGWSSPGIHRTVRKARFCIPANAHGDKRIPG